MTDQKDPFSGPITWRERLRWFVDEWNPLLWKFRVEIRGFNDGTSWLIDETTCGHDLLLEHYYRPPRFMFRKAYDLGFDEGLSK